MSESSSVPSIFNKVIKFILHSPLHGVVSKYLLLITFTGRKSGKTYTTPVSYYLENNRVTIFTHATWWKNLRGGELVSLWLQGREIHGLAEPIVEDKQAIVKALTEHLQKSPFDARFYDVGIDESGHPIAEDIEKAVHTVTMICIQID